MNLRDIIKEAGLTQREAADALGAKLYTLRVWLREGIPHEPAALAWMWSLGLATPRRVDDGWRVEPLQPPGQSELRALEILFDAFREAERLVDPLPDAGWVKNDPEGLTDGTTSGTVGAMSRNASAKDYPGEIAEQKVSYVTYPTQHERVKAAADRMGIGLAEFMRRAAERQLREVPPSDG